ncbi:MAG: ABC transporter ATP-binding protein [Hoeflea sp.]|uniref:ABC transporter ATP-binding protein n=1 Tax=Hoeflea sp. TaxID=1940281 RepID=UPI001DAB8D74|nr:ABC transporter ATP-binding protein [Hoeflea sp.]MBU4530353.1 ABC transporter ATP-binding protein [Alphaproteobacteria bacterium]MBU4545140.1 ABC transporter ATP-binding protein [Alphaproteobacteria bacterium]MBU4549660.1 ABC transporter ATP-binding protein [Alphaproteobacteria bacterium]MBV1721943.1 ABC transporter ATP-binding protein [Hoeflea sp.]MBV1761293.1 ABC transporter ATP-binding protein [Hoeflea sp.]
MTEIVKARNVSMKFKAVDALTDVSLDVAPGEQVALLGHNGAGKTTLFRIMLGFIKPTAGSISIAGFAPGSNEARRIVSYLPEQVAFPKMLTGREVVRFYARLKGAPLDDVQSVLAKVDLVDAADRRVETYSKGMRQRLGLAQALVGKPALLLLDEPTSGLDPLSRQHFYELIADVARQGGSVLLSSHGLSELEAKTDRVAILRNGRLVANGPLAALQDEANLPVRIRVRAAATAIDKVHAEIGGGRINGASVELFCARGEKMRILSKISGLGAKVEDVDVAAPTLDEVYRHFSKIGVDEALRGTL